MICHPRPVMVLFNLSIAFEGSVPAVSDLFGKRVINDQFYKYLNNDKDLLASLQSGFRLLHNTLAQSF